jgi:hypothetical protein
MAALISSAGGFDAEALTAYGVPGSTSVPGGTSHATTLAYDGIRHGLRVKTPAFSPRAVALGARAASAIMRARVSLEADDGFAELLAAIGERVAELTGAWCEQSAQAPATLDFVLDERIAVFDADTRSGLAYADAGDLARLLEDRPVAWLLELHGVLVKASGEDACMKLAWRATQALVYPVLDTNPWGAGYPFIDEDDAGSLYDYDDDDAWASAAPAAKQTAEHTNVLSPTSQQ